jgi:hypothetical protein
MKFELRLAVKPVCYIIPFHFQLGAAQSRHSRAVLRPNFIKTAFWVISKVFGRGIDYLFKGK